MKLRSGKFVSVGRLTVERLTVVPPLSSNDLEEELLPGIPNGITLNMITPKLFWTDIPTLHSLSRGWEKAIQGDLVHDARVRTQSVNTHAVFARDVSTKIEIFLELSMKDNAWFRLPPIPGLPQGFPVHCQCVSMDCRIYILGGAPSYRMKNYAKSFNTTYMLDLAGRRKWKQCANMTEARQDFDVNIVDGKIYVSGGHLNREPVRGKEVYDPKVHSWCMIEPVAAPEVA